VAGRPKVAVLSTGGTIASPATTEGGAVPQLAAPHLVAAVPQLAEVADVAPASFRQVPSPELTVLDLLELAAEARRLVESGAAGTVVTQGTDSVEETAFVLDLLWEREEPIVVTGAMRNPSLPGADGPANLLAAVRVAASPSARGLGCLVVLNDEIHAARFVQKTHTSNPATFRSRLTGPIGWLCEDRVRLAVRPIGRHHLRPRGRDVPAVALLKVGLGDDGRLIGVVPELGFAGLVVEAMGGGHLPGALVGPLERVARAMPVVLASRTGGGELLRETYGFPGSERDLLGRGLIAAGALDGLKSRLLLTLLLMAGAGADELREAFATVGGPGAAAGAGELRLG
jgi:L-asparaginase